MSEAIGGVAATAVTYSRSTAIQVAGAWKVPFLRFKDGDLSSAYRELHLYVRVR